MMSNLNVLLLLVFCAFAECVNGQKDDLFFIATDTIYGMVDKNYKKDFDSEKAYPWNFRDINAPCYENILVKLNENKNSTQFLTAQGKFAHYTKKNNALKVLNQRWPSLFLSDDDINVSFEKGVVVFKEDIDIYEEWSSKDKMEYELEMPEQISNHPDFSKFKKLKLHLKLTQKSRVEAINDVSLPGSIQSVTLVANDLSIVLLSIEGFENEAWKLLDQDQFKKLVGEESTEQKIKIWRYFGNTSPFLYCELFLDTEEKAESIRFFNSRKPSGTSRCNSNSEAIYVYPNPGFGKINVQFNNKDIGNYQFQVYNILGKEIAKKDFQLDEKNQIIKLDFSFLQKGTYLYGIIDPKGERIITKKLVIISI